jgi:hypothetical protein
MNPWNRTLRIWPAVILAALTPLALLTARVGSAGTPSNGLAFVVLNHPLADSPDGSSLNVVSGAFDDSGPTTGDWDFNFFDDGTDGLTLRTIATHATEYVVDGSGNVAVLAPGATIGPASSFSSANGGPMAAPALRAGVNGSIGVRFACDGRLANPVAGGVCYGYISLTTTAPTGFPATAQIASFDGDGNAIQIPGGNTPPPPPPSMTLAPTSLSFTVAANAVQWKPLNIANAAGSDWLVVHLAAQESDGAAAPAGAGVVSTGGSARRISSLRPVAPAPAAGAAAPRSVWAVNGDISFAFDDGTIEAAYGLGSLPPPIPHEVGAVFVNRFSASEALTIDSVSIYWPGQTLAQGDLTGLTANLVAYYDADADGDPTNAVRIGGDHLVTIDQTDAFQTYPTSFGVPGAGDVYVGFVDQWAVTPGPPPLPARKYPAAIDTTNPQQQSYVSAPASGQTVDWNNLANNAQTGTIDSVSGGSTAGNLMVRATASPGSGGGGPSCSGSAVDWLTVSPPAMQIYQGADDYDVVVRANPSAASLAPGDYTASICITSNDPDHSVVSVPVSLTVTEVPCHAQDEIFCGSFEAAAGTGQAGVYQTREEFLSHVAGGYYENSFDDLPSSDAPSPALSFSDPASGLAYTVDSIAHNDQLWIKDGFITANYSADQILITFTGAPVTAVGGNFYANDGFLGNPIVGNTVVVTLSDGTVETFTTQSADDFRGFTSSLPIANIAIDTPNPSNLFDQSWATVDNLIVGSAQ